jgi:tRNA A-37 threonylcarbamoyl transferase component Bud32
MLNYELISDWALIYKDGDRAFKLYSFNNSYGYVSEKARAHTLAYNAGLPVPAIYGVRKIDEDNNALEMDYIAGKPFICEEGRGKTLDIMAKLQCEINAVDASGFDLPRFSKDLADEIEGTSYLTKQIKGKVFDLLSRLETGKTNLCHGDFHSQNILFDGKKYWVIDWDGASTGDPAADACMTYFYEKRSKPDTAEIYLHSYCKYSNIRQEDILAWQPVIAAYQVNIKTKNERDFILDFIEEWYRRQIN